MCYLNSVVSIIIPCWNVEKYLSRCMESIIEQTYKNIEVILINDGSSDSTLEICREYERLDYRIKVISQDNKGVSSARNQGMKYAGGDYIMFIDPDDYVENHYVERMLSIAHNHQAKMVVCHGLDCNEDGSIYEEKKRYLSKAKEERILFNEKYHFGDYYSHATVWGVLFRKDIIQGLRFDKTLFVGEDTLFYIQAMKKSKEIYYLAEGMYHYIHYSSSAAHGAYNDKKLTEINSWEKVIDILPPHTLVWESAKGQIVARCIKMLKLMYASSEIDKVTEQKLLKIIRNNILYNIKFSKKYKSNLAHILFSIAPRIYFRLKSVYK